MSQARAYLFSFLALQRVVAGEAFDAQYPHPWLVWEPGAWHAPTLEATLPAPGPVDPTRLYPGDALCFELAARPGARLHLGRAPENEVVINDATISRTHLWLERDAGGSFTVAALPGRAAVLNGAPLTGQATPLPSGSSLKVGAVQLTFHAPADFARRLLEQRVGR